MAERGVKPLDGRWRQGRAQDRVDVVLDVGLVAGSEDNDIGTLQMPRRMAMSGRVTAGQGTGSVMS